MAKRKKFLNEVSSIRRFMLRCWKTRHALLTVELDVYRDKDGGLHIDFVSVAKPGNFELTRHCMAACIKKLQQQMRDQKQCPFHPDNFPDDVSHKR